jgi:integrase/recombinase XerC
MTAEQSHLEHLRLKGHTPTSVYARKRALARLTAWLEAQENPGRSGNRPGWMLAATAELLYATPADLADWRASLTVGDDAVVAYVSHVKSFYKFCMDEGLRADNPAASLPVPRLGRRIPRPIAEDDLMDALAAAPRRIRLMLVLAGWCGLRAKEIAYLRRENVMDTASPPVLLVAGDATKGRAERVVPLSAFVLAEIAAARIPPSGYVFRRMDGRPGPNEPWRVSQLCCRHLHRHGISASLHQLRHRYGTQFYRASGRDLRLTQETMGHARPETTAGYTLTDRPEAAAAAEAIPAPARLRSVARG